MGEPGKLYRPRTFMAARARSHMLLLNAVVLLAWPAVISAAVTVSASLSEALYSAESNTDCASLNALKDQGTAGGVGELPMNVVRLRATVPGVPDDKVSFRWSVLKPEFGVLVADPNGQSLPLFGHYEFSNGAGDTADTEGSCTFEDGRHFDACTGAKGELDYHAMGRFLAAVKEVFADNSALCDNITVQVLACAPRGGVQVIRRPRLTAYTPGNPRTGKVDVTVRLRNLSVAEHGLPACGFLLDENVLTCAEEAVFAGGSATKSTQFTLEQLGIPSDFVLRPGRSIVLLKLNNVPLINVLPDTATLTDIWTAQTVNAGGFDATDKYRIKGRPGVPAPAP